MANLAIPHVDKKHVLQNTWYKTTLPRFCNCCNKTISKEELVDALADVCAIYVSANITTQLSSANCIQQCVNNVMTQVVELKLVNEIVGIAESSSKTFPRVDEFEVGASYRRCT